MDFIGILGARKFKDRLAVEKLVMSLPKNSIIVTSGCKGVCTWTQTIARQWNMEVKVYAPDLSTIRSNFEIPKRYYQRNRELIEQCNFIHAFISQENGYRGGTRFEIEYAVKIKIPVMVHWEQGIDEIMHQDHLKSKSPQQVFSTAWQNFFSENFAV